MEIKLRLSSKQILDEKFPSSSRGYNPLKVDEFLDLIIADYQKIEGHKLLDEKESLQLEKRVAQLEEDKKKLEIELEKYKNILSGIENNKNVSIDNIDLIKRINALEKYIYQHGTNPDIIK